VRTVVLLGKPDCHLCHVMEDVVAPVLAGRGIDLVVRDVREDAELLRRYRYEIPVLLMGDVELARHRITVEELNRRLDGMSHGDTETRRTEERESKKED
jgi:glutaredoxin-like protein DUF836